MNFFISNLTSMTGYSDYGTGPTSFGGGMLAAFGIFFFIFAILGIAVTVLWMLSIYDWGFRKEEEFSGGFEEKKKWFFKLFLTVFLVPVAFIPILGALVMLVGYIVWAVFVFMYFFQVRKMPRSDGSSSPGNASTSSTPTPTPPASPSNPVS